MQNEEKYSLYIPLGLKTRSEIFEGFGKSELFQTIVMTIVSSIIDVFIYLINRNISVCMVFILTAIAGSVMMLTKDISNVSVVEQSKFLLRFIRSQKCYSYKYLDEWR